MASLVSQHIMTIKATEILRLKGHFSPPSTSQQQLFQHRAYSLPFTTCTIQYIEEFLVRYFPVLHFPVLHF